MTNHSVTRQPCAVSVLHVCERLKPRFKRSRLGLDSPSAGPKPVSDRPGMELQAWPARFGLAHISVRRPRNAAPLRTTSATCQPAKGQHGRVPGAVATHPSAGAAGGNAWLDSADDTISDPCADKCGATAAAAGASTATCTLRTGAIDAVVLPAGQHGHILQCHSVAGRAKCPSALPACAQASVHHTCSSRC